jgi:hypothetical protein
MNEFPSGDDFRLPDPSLRAVILMTVVAGSPQILDCQA